MTSVGVVALALISPNAMATATTSKASTAGAHPASAAVDLFADRVETLGVGRYPATFAGATLIPTGVTVVYAVAASDAKLVRAVRALDRHGYPVKVVAVKRSYSQLMAISAKVLRAYPRLRAKGINPAQFGPDPASGTAAVTLRKPTAAGMSALASAQGAPVTSSNYRAEASAALRQQAGPGITLRSQYETGSPVLTSGRDSDVAPYYSGDDIYHVGSGEICTSGFNLIGPGGGKYMVTDGHCGDGTWKTHASTMGNTSENFFGGNSTDDFQLTYLAGASAYVWTSNTDVAPVTGALFPAVGAPITFDGGKTGEVRGVTVQSVSQTMCALDLDNAATVCATNQTVAQKTPRSSSSCSRAWCTTDVPNWLVKSSPSSGSPAAANRSSHRRSRATASEAATAGVTALAI